MAVTTPVDAGTIFARACPQTDPQVVGISGKQRPQEGARGRWIVQPMARKTRARTHVHRDG
jgi:hypothetical protein